ncbi:MFS transporter [Aurantiacibacter sp. MUD11]|uniref:spinster family MFS transporter n=1 Tax=Aurantiacibacter sp. MUD11 TaxID=3003265 RepID=UPI0022AA1987|nr:MFS transporter [Aurantiacibacter sp. MUD11]WAT17370.1 MFS transporter [Aurantiacibacter sp. MUD11]
MITRRNSPWLALVVLASIGTVGFIDRIVVNVLVEPVKAEFGLTDFQVSLMAWAFAALNIIFGIVVARFAERVRRLTLISVGAVAWSIATALCGAAASWVQLLVARMGVGLGEAIGLPSNQSVIADYFPANKRGFAMSVLLLSPPLGAFIGFVGGGWIAQEFDWRMTFLIAAIPGLLLGFIAYFFVAEPKRGQHDPGASDEVPPLSAVVKRLFALPSGRNLVIGSALAAMLGFGLNYFFTSLMVRQFELGLAEAGLYAGLIASLPAALSVLGSGWLGDKLGEKNIAAYALVPGVALLLGAPLYAFAITRESLVLLLGLVSVATFLNFGYLGITYAALQNLMHPRMRATASALLSGVYGIASGLGPSLLGLLSDWLSDGYGPARGLALAMAIGGLMYAWASAHYFIAARHLPRDSEAIRQGAS